MPPVIVEPLTALPRTDPQRKQAYVLLELATTTGLWEPVRMRVDTGASASLLSWDRFGPAGINLDLTRVSELRGVTINLPTGGAATRQGYTANFRARFPAHPNWVFTWGCLFVTGLPAGTDPLLGIGSRLLSDVYITFRGWTRNHPDYLPGSVAFDIQAAPSLPNPAPVAAP